MTNEEKLAKEYTDKMAEQYVGLKEDCYVNIKEAYLNGYKKGVYQADKENERLRKEIGRLQSLLADEVHKHKVTKDKIKWHKVADGDLPDTIRDVLSDKGSCVYYDYVNKVWVAPIEDLELHNVVAWCEIPKCEE